MRQEGEVETLANLTKATISGTGGGLWPREKWNHLSFWRFSPSFIVIFGEM